MGLNIKSEAVHRLAKEVANETGTTMTGAIEAALREKLARIHDERERDVRIERFRERLEALGPPPSGLTSDHSDLYGEDGLPV
jgi:antitoxin VapB